MSEVWAGLLQIGEVFGVFQTLDHLLVVLDRDDDRDGLPLGVTISGSAKAAFMCAG